MKKSKWVRLELTRQSAVFSPVDHPYIYRSVFVDGRIHAPDLYGFAPRFCVTANFIQHNKSSGLRFKITEPRGIRPSTHQGAFRSISGESL